jgi:hypothetical protein
VLDLRSAEGCFREDKVKGVAAFRFTEGCRILEGRKTSKSAVRFVRPVSQVDRGRSCRGEGGVTLRSFGRGLARVGERSPGSVFGRQRSCVGAVLLERRERTASVGRRCGRAGWNDRDVSAPRGARILEREELQRPGNPKGVSGMRQDREATNQPRPLRG